MQASPGGIAEAAEGLEGQTWERGQAGRHWATGLRLAGLAQHIGHAIGAARTSFTHVVRLERGDS